jgi:hypothetical protein
LVLRLTSVLGVLLAALALAPLQPSSPDLVAANHADNDPGIWILVKILASADFAS